MQLPPFAPSLPHALLVRKWQYCTVLEQFLTYVSHGRVRSCTALGYQCQPGAPVIRTKFGGSGEIHLVHLVTLPTTAIRTHQRGGEELEATGPSSEYCARLLRPDDGACQASPSLLPLGRGPFCLPFQAEGISMIQPCLPSVTRPTPMNPARITRPLPFSLGPGTVQL
ncbi:hypothetical protein CALVIDRAFT_309364 [Calocera viscosa TUFC12733]|uniref:Uncharacterized protein n=1 Tax=Calocera viscosa (strain TUFC12733) TaxID=1330018 RepID=A0A167I804_CALVF|nr:hypothetical protein CALVIDRAFT_309364 [Calocera viscosa TUFC12733]